MAFYFRRNHGHTSGSAEGQVAYGDLTGVPATFDPAVHAFDSAQHTGQAAGLSTITSGLSVGVSYAIRKTADTTINTDATLNADTELLVAVVANGVYFVEGFMQVTGTNLTHDIQFGWTFPAGLTARWGWTNNTGLPSFGVVGTGVTPNANVDLALQTVALPIGLDAETYGAAFVGWFYNSTTAGTLTLTWAQNTSDAGNLTLKRGSLLRVTRLE